MKRILFFMIAAGLTLASCAPKQAKTAGINYAYMDTTARPGDQVRYRMNTEKIHVFDKETEKTITN